MDWIKKNYDQFLLALFAVALIAVSVLMFLRTQGFSDAFSAASASPNKSRKIPEVDTSVIGTARQKLTSPTEWRSPNHGGLLFTSERYYLKNGQIQKPERESIYNHSRTGAPIPNAYFLTNQLPLLDPNAPFADPDGDGFPNEDEWLYKTNPNNKEVHPEYHTLAFLNRWIKVKFRLKFQAWDGDPKMPDKMEFQINPLDAGARTEFVKIGDTIAGTKFKVIKFEFKERLNPKTGEKEDKSELAVVNVETNEPVVLILNEEVDSPNQFAEFDYRWNTNTRAKGQIFAVPRLKEFVLKPVLDKYKLLDVNATEAVIETPKGEKVSVKPYPTTVPAPTAAAPAAGAQPAAPGTEPPPTANQPN